MHLGLTGKRALVLAASRGLGYACARSLAQEGCQVVICSRDPQRIEHAAHQIQQETGSLVIPVATAVEEPGALQTLVDTCVNQLGGLDIALHNAGGPPAGSFTSLTNEQWTQAIELNLLSFVHLVQAVVPVMRQGGYGRILAITSSSIKQPIPNLALSNTLRTGVWGLAKTLARELAPSGILVNVIAPGRIATERISELDAAFAKQQGKSPETIRAESLAQIPLGRLGDPQELANVVTFLASEAASYVTGAAIQVDGGLISALM